MRILATVSLSFSLGTLLAVLLRWENWQLWAGLFLLAAAAATWLPWKRKLMLPSHLLRLRLVVIPLAAALLYFVGYRQVVQQPVVDRCGQQLPFAGTVADWPEETENGARVTLWLEDHFFAKAVYYGEESLLQLEPGQVLRGEAYWQNAARIRDDEITTFTAKGAYALLYSRGELEISEGSKLLFFPQYALRAMQEQIAKIWSDPTVSGFLTAELTGEESGIPDRENGILRAVGLSHLFSVSGLHCAFLVSLLQVLIPVKHRRITAAVSIGILLFYMAMVGMTPSVVRACIMQTFVLVAPLFLRDSDALTSLGAALLVILLHNPFASASVSLQLSFAATFGLCTISSRMSQWLVVRFRSTNRWVQKGLRFLWANLSASLGVLFFTVPLTAIYFGTFSIISPLSNLLAVPAAGWIFMWGFLTTLLSFLWLPIAQWIGWLCWLLVKYVLGVSDLLAMLPDHVLYFTNPYLSLWMLYCYGMLVLCLFTRAGRRKYAVAGVLAVLTLLLTVHLGRMTYRTGVLSAVAVDVGQGESVLLCSDGETMLVDCGSSNNYIDAAERVLQQLGSMGDTRLEALAVTHYHADHTNGIRRLLDRVEVDTVYLPDIADEYGVREELMELARGKGAEVVLVQKDRKVALGDAQVQIYMPLGKGDLNEMGLTYHCTAGEFDLLITGDMGAETEVALAQRYDLSDIEVLLVSHHGSRYSSDAEFLQQIQPETAVISVGDNSYGHPTREALRRLSAVDAQIYRTDLHGNILITVGK